MPPLLIHYPVTSKIQFSGVTVQAGFVILLFGDSPVINKWKTGIVNAL